ncbi:MAG: fumarate hydratase [Armatimonadota bacterium]|nr:fumarate hydratase [Armatimonadota bacterium]MDR7453091.1 fumarate hydratase [Armatimonadota bacterium]MDR7457694.1 fumarate hydratase [Armatimonadota bacterium]MDR7495781.1 fumarate hydratase [Armatimonadota bacterium]MDR7510813.1 fumarate hydratase [Armatimonadota bacterium]
MQEAAGDVRGHLRARRRRIDASPSASPCAGPALVLEGAILVEASRRGDGEAIVRSGPGFDVQIADKRRALVCRDTGMPIFYVTLGTRLHVNGARLAGAIRRGTERAAPEHPLRSSICHPITRENPQTNTGRGAPWAAGLALVAYGGWGLVLLAR